MTNLVLLLLVWILGVIHSGLSPKDDEVCLGGNSKTTMTVGVVLKLAARRNTSDRGSQGQATVKGAFTSATLLLKVLQRAGLAKRLFPPNSIGPVCIHRLAQAIGKHYQTVSGAGRSISRLLP